MKTALILVGLLLMAGCDSITGTPVLHIRNGQILMDNIARECKGELTITIRLSGDSEILATCTQTGPIDGSLISTPDQEKE